MFPALHCNRPDGESVFPTVHLDPCEQDREDHPDIDI